MSGIWCTAVTVDLPCGCAVEVDHNRGQRSTTCACDVTYVITATHATVNYTIAAKPVAS